MTATTWDEAKTVQDVADVATALKRAEVCALDFEFELRSTYFPEPAYAQVAWREGDKLRGVLVDLVALDAPSIQPLLEAPTEIAMFAFSSDMKVLARLGLKPPEQLFDVSLAPGFVGDADLCQRGLGTMCKQMLEMDVDSSLQVSRWLKRPLSQAHLEYAMSGAFALLLIHEKFRTERLDSERMNWLQQETRYLALRSYSVDPMISNAGPKPSHRLSPRDRGRLMDAVVWRERRAMSRNRPRGWMCSNGELMELALEGKIGPVCKERLSRKREVMYENLLETLQSSQEIPSPRQSPELMKALKREATHIVKTLNVVPSLAVAARDVQDATEAILSGHQAFEEWRTSLPQWRNEQIWSPVIENDALGQSLPASLQSDIQQLRAS